METDRSLAQSLFEQGKRLMDGGNLEHACPKLEESQRLDPGGGTLLNLALCHEKQGKIATAWTDFKGALSAARRDGRQDRITAAEEHIAALEPKLPWLTLSATGVVEGEEIKLDGAAIGRAAWGSPVSIDPGAHELRATAPGRKPWTLALTIAIGEKRTVTIPALEADPNQAAPAAGSAAAPPPLPADRERSKESRGRTVGWIIGGAGVASLGVGTFFGIRALSKRKESGHLCPTDTTCSDDGVRLNEDAKTSAWISNIGIGLGLAGVGIGTYIIVSNGGSGGQMSLAGTW